MNLTTNSVTSSLIHREQLEVNASCMTDEARKQSVGGTTANLESKQKKCKPKAKPVRAYKAGATML